ncbi:MAG: helix-turn-helix domain-containing protein [Pigmentiphaga sp.]|nr:helix-turn-helix domain-containing protein [Pigmentiphaga sp.]
MSYDLEDFAERLREARNAKHLSQRELSKLAGVPQAHISRIESKQVDLRLSSLIAIANALDLEVTLVPRQALPAVQSIARQAAKKMTALRNQVLRAPSQQESTTPAKPAYSLDEEDDQ